MEPPDGRLAADTLLHHDPRAEFRDMADEGGVVLHLDTAEYYGLNPVGALIWKLADGVTYADLLAALHRELSGVPESFEGEVQEYLTQLHDRSLLRLGGGGLAT